MAIRGRDQTGLAASAAMSFGPIFEAKRHDIEVVAINDLGPVETQRPSVCATTRCMAASPGNRDGRRAISISLGQRQDQGHLGARSRDPAVERARQSTSPWNAPASSAPRPRHRRI